MFAWYPELIFFFDLFLSQKGAIVLFSHTYIRGDCKVAKYRRGVVLRRRKRERIIVCEQTDWEREDRKKEEKQTSKTNKHTERLKTIDSVSEV